MEMTVKRGSALKQRGACVILGAFEGKRPGKELLELDQALDGALTRAWQQQGFTGAAQQVLLLHAPATLAAERVLLVGLGKAREANLEGLRLAAASAVRQLQERRISSCAVALAECVVPRSSVAERFAAVAEGMLLADYRFDLYRTEEIDKLPPTLARAVLLVTQGDDQIAAATAIEKAQHLLRGVCFARDLVNEPGNVKSPQHLAERARQMADEVGLACTILDKPALEKEKMGALLGVAQGSEREPRLIVLEHRGGKKGEAPVALVGKGVVFDAGGISLKPAEKMDEMKMDMAGGAAVLGTLFAAALLDLPLNLVGVVPAVENLPSGTAIRPGDILTTLSGTTVEVLNTDAEGRLILADALTYVRRFEPRTVIDLATLTGACIIALGHHAAAVLGSDERLVQKLLKAGERSGEKLWQLPLWADYSKQIKSEVADIKNIGGRAAGTITAAAFLQHFTRDLSWAHLDIAGTAWADSTRPCYPKGGTGVGVRLLIEYLKSVSK
ncbi:MAG: leucyl aminopeptidase [Desulfuromonas sp.]|nr:MAG: leucyl aminopeptidase [Desulfuromonas sp.]